MNAAIAHTPSLLACPRCKGPVDVKSRHVAVTGSAVRVYCSADCLAGITMPIEVGSSQAIEEPSSRRSVWLAAGGVVIGTTCLVVFYGGGSDAADRAAAPPAPIIATPPPPPAAQPAVIEETAEQREDKALLSELMQDAWIHPLAGPRRMPINHNAAFGAVRDGVDRPECVSGHCGVDLGGSIWGEPVHAVHEGVIDTVNRGPNDEHGGVFVKIAHRGGALYTWYFHLAAVPRWISPGVKVTAGQVIGLVGDTGVKHSGPHLHFAMTVKKPNGGSERYLDPEPLIAIWPLWIPDGTKASGRLSTAEAPGVPVRAPSRRKPKPPMASPASAPDVPTPAPPTAPAATPAPIPAPTPAPASGVVETSSL